MREIKFRAWIENEKRMKEVLGFRFHLRDVLLENGQIEDFKCVEIMQFTGLKDKDGKEIYEGDILGSLYEGELCAEGIVSYSEELGNYLLVGVDEYASDSDYCYDADEWNQLEVIGNIYENPELMEVKE